jgi:hypothetical protein
MGLTLTKVEDYRPVPGQTDQLRLVATNHYVRIRALEGGPYYIQNGRVYGEGGSEITELPEWFMNEVKKINPAHLREVKFVLPGQEVSVDPAPQKVVQTVNLRHCDECGRDVEPKKWGVHIANHRKQAR